MSALPLRLALVALAAAIPVSLAACAGHTSNATSSDESALTAADDERFLALLLEAFGSSTPTNFQKTTEDHACVSSDNASTTVEWNAIGGQWTAPTLRAFFSVKKLSSQLTVVEVPSKTDGHVDFYFYGTPTNLDGAAGSICAGDNASGTKLLLLTCTNIATTGTTGATIDASQCQR